MKKLSREPLIHFLLIGLALFLIYGMVSSKNDSEDTIVIDDYDMNNIIASWEMQWKRLPTDAELKNLILQNIKQEIFYQEALKMNLDHNDEIIKRRLAQKMKFLSNDIASLKEPNDQEIKAFYENNLESYMTPYSFTLYQIVFSPDNRVDPKKNAEETLTLLDPDNPKTAHNFGDKMSLSFYYQDITDFNLNRQLGMEFTKTLRTMPLKKWGLIKSGFGYHLVYLDRIVKPQPQDLEQVKKDVLRDLEYKNQQDMDSTIYNGLRNNYSIIYDLDPNKFDATFVEYLNE